jgi:hypothetical protein
LTFFGSGAKMCLLDGNMAERLQASRLFTLPAIASLPKAWLEPQFTSATNSLVESSAAS